MICINVSKFESSVFHLNNILSFFLEYSVNFINFHYETPSSINKPNDRSTEIFVLVIKQYFRKILDLYKKYGGFRIASTTTFCCEEIIQRIKSKTHEGLVHKSQITDIVSKMWLKLDGAEVIVCLNVPFNILVDDDEI